MLNSQSMIPKALSDLGIEQFEYCEILKDYNIYQVHVPKLMALIPKNIPSNPVHEPVPTNMLANSPECKITITTRTEVMNYLDVKPFGDQPYSGNIRKGDKLLCFVAHGIRNIYITNFINHK